MFCKTCGAELPEGARFCGTCGEDLHEVELQGRPLLPSGATVAAASSASADQLQAAEDREAKTIMKIGLVGVAVLGLLVLALLWPHKCDFCGETYFGPGGSINAGYDVQICNDCAENYHWLGI